MENFLKEKIFFEVDPIGHPLWQGRGYDTFMFLYKNFVAEGVLKNRVNGP